MTNCTYVHVLYHLIMVVHHCITVEHVYNGHPWVNKSNNYTEVTLNQNVL